jgi:uncharacterized protein (DUF433 family)
MTRYALNLPQELKHEAEKIAGRQGVSLNQFILWSVAEKVASLRHGVDDPAYPGITYRRGAAGQPTPVLQGTGIRVQAIVIANDTWRMTPEQIAEDYGVPAPQVREALAFYQAHRAEIDLGIQAESSLAAQHERRPRKNPRVKAETAPRR